MVAGDEESYELFKDLFDPVISARHNGYGPDAQHPTNLNVAELSTTKIDPDGKYVITSRCRTGRSVRGFRLPPCCDFEERRKLEATIVKSLLTLEDDLKGDYYPLAGSRSYAPKPNGMSLEKEEELRNAGNLFQEPDSTLLLSSGCGRHWPDARGIYHNDDANLFVWVNEEDQMRIVSMEKGDNVRGIIERFSKGTAQIQKCLQAQGHDFMHNDHLGWILTCPSNLGTGLRAGAMVKVPLFSSRADFKAILGTMGLQARGCGGVDCDSVGGTWDISNADRLGKSEVHLVNIFIEGVAQIIRWEKQLENGESIDSTMAADMAAVADKVAGKKPEIEITPVELTDDYPPQGLSASVRALPEWIQSGCGEKEYYSEEKGATFLSSNMPEELDLEKHNSFFSNVMKENPELYQSLKDKTTSLGVNLGHCIKTGVDNPGHPHIKTVGLVAGDEESYEVFKDLFDPVISARHNGYAADAHHPTNLNVDELSTTKIDPDGKYVITSRCRTGRSVRGFRLPPCCDFEERRRLEAIIVKSLLSLEGDLKGDYYPLAGSRSYGPKPNGMTIEKEEELRSAGNLFQEPDSTLLLSSGCGRHWPDARGIYHNVDANLFVWVNEEDQMRIVSMEKGDNVRGIIERFSKGTAQIQKCLQENGYDFMHSDHLGWILTCPSNLGTGLRAGAMLTVPLFSAREDFKTVLASMGLQARGCGGVDSDSVGGTWDISNADRLGKSEVHLVNIFIEGAAQIVQWEKRLENGENIDETMESDIAALIKRVTPGQDYPPEGLSASVRALPQWIQAGCGGDEYYSVEKGATFLSDNMPDKLDLSKHNSFFADAIKANPKIYQNLKDKKTSLGVTLGQCIKTGVDNPGHPHIKTVGMVAGDEESYEVFKELFDPVIEARHNGYGPLDVHPTDLDVSKLSVERIDPTGKYVITSRCRTGRSVRGFKLPPVIGFEERRALEHIVVKSLLSLEGDLSGDYFPLHGSRSYAAKPNGMSVEKEEELRSAGNLFQEPDSTLLLSSGCGRHWPDARGIFHNDAGNLFVWVNEEDQMRIVSMEKGDDVRGIIERFSKSTSQIQTCLKEQGYDFMHSDHLGWILTCPSNLGTGLRAGAMVKIPLFSSRPDFKDVLAGMGLQARGTAGVDSASVGGTWDISNADRLGKSEVELVNIFIEGVAKIIRWEQELEKGRMIEDAIYVCSFLIMNIGNEDILLK